MTVVARHWVNFNGVWHRPGERFEADSIEELRDYVIVMGEPVISAPPVEADEPTVIAEPEPVEPEPVEAEAPKPKRGRPRKTE